MQRYRLMKELKDKPAQAEDRKWSEDMFENIKFMYSKELE